MKKRLFLFLFLVPALLRGQDVAKYMAGAVPVVDGKVVFSREVGLPGQSKEAVYARALKWATEKFVPKEQFRSRVLFSDGKTGQIACLGQQYLVFANKALSLDRAVVNYQMYLEAQAERCVLKISAIRYIYNVAGKDEMIPAEEQITDEYTLNKKKDRMIKATGKFRIHTVDLVDSLFDDAAGVLGAGSVSRGQSGARPDGDVVVSVAEHPDAADIAVTLNGGTLEGYKRISPDKIPGNIYKMLAENWMLVTGGNDRQFNMMTASWGGLGHLFDKPVAFCFVRPSHYTYKLLEGHDTYTLSFYTEAYRGALEYCGSHSGKDGDKVKGAGLTPITTPSGSKAFSEAWMILECKKILAQQFAPEAVYDPVAKEKWGSDLHGMFVGEIMNVWVK